MDTQRLILFVIFSFSALFLWERWQAEHRPPVPPPATQQAAPSSGLDAPVPAGAITPPPVPSAIPPTLPGAVPGVVTATSPSSEKVVVKTDLYTATVDTLGAVLTEIDLAAHRDTYDEASRTYCCRKTPSGPLSRRRDC
jgi:YidC/Oxa1 family membrane protein insertase